MLEVSNSKKEARELVCPVCSFANMLGEKYCSECGEPLNNEGSAAPVVSLIDESDPEAPPEPPVKPAKLKHINCRFCGSKNKLGNKYCFECGGPLVSHTAPNKNVQVTASAVRSKKETEDDEDEIPSHLPKNAILQGRYQITKLIGQGGMGSIYLADDMRFSRRVAVVKEMLDHFADPEQRKIATNNFDREAEMLANLNHPGIPEVYDRFTEGNRHYLVMEYIDGDDLEQKMADRDQEPFLEKDVINWAIQICEILKYMHDHDTPIIYRDMKPANLILKNNGRIYMVDFGIARHFNPTKKGTMIGTQGYAPPEQYRGQVEPRSDIYALGATMHHLLTGRDPQSEAPFTFPPIRELNNRISPQLEKIVIRCLSMEPESRYKDAADLIETLKRLSQRQPSNTPEIGGQTVPINSKGISTALMKLGLSHKLFSVEWLLRFNIVLLTVVVLLLILLLVKN